MRRCCSRATTSLAPTCVAPSEPARYPPPTELHHRLGDAVDAAAAELVAAHAFDRLGDFVAARAGALRDAREGEDLACPRRAPPAICGRCRRRGLRCWRAATRTRRNARMGSAASRMRPGEAAPRGEGRPSSCLLPWTGRGRLVHMHASIGAKGFAVMGRTRLPFACPRRIAKRGCRRGNPKV
jgi:hypothetical protein